MLATAPQGDLPFKVVEFHNRRTGSLSWRVTGSGAKNGRIRKNFSVERGGEAAARSECERFNADEIRAAAQLPALRAQATRLTEAEITAVEAARERGQRAGWELAEILEAGLVALKQKAPAVEIAPLFDDWKAGPANELKGRWRNDLENIVERFLKAQPGLTSHAWTSSLTRAWLDSLGVSGQTKANYRNALHRFGRWICERLDLKDNPAGGLLISRAADKEGLPVVFTVNQVETLFDVCQNDAACRPLLGWLTLTVLCGLRPESEAPALQWTQVRWREREIILKGNKRGSKPRLVHLQPAAFEFLRIVERESPQQPGFFTRGFVTRLERLTSAALIAKRHSALPAGQDINRHTYASMRAAMGVTLDALAKEMGNDPATLLGHYIHPIAKRDALRFWAIRPGGSSTRVKQSIGS